MHFLIVPPTGPTAFIIQAAFTASLNLLRLINSTDLKIKPVYLAKGHSTSQDVLAAFEEAFRVLLACGTQSLIANGVLRMLIGSARRLNIDLPVAVNVIVQALQLWQPANLDKIQSHFPNYATVRSVHSRAGAEMEELLRQWADMAL